MSSAEPLVALPDEAATEALGAALAPGAQAGSYLALRGDLGVGKTALARALLRALGVAGRIRSPSFTLVEPYEAGGLPIFHFDFYRFADADEWLDAGFDEHFDGSALCLVEWPERAGRHLRAADLDVTLQVRPEGGRLARLHAFTPTGRQWLDTTLRAWSAHAPGGAR